MEALRFCAMAPGKRLLNWLRGDVKMDVKSTLLQSSAALMNCLDSCVFLQLALIRIEVSELC